MNLIIAENRYRSFFEKSIFVDSLKRPKVEIIVSHGNCIGHLPFIFYKNGKRSQVAYAETENIGYCGVSIYGLLKSTHDLHQLKHDSPLIAKVPGYEKQFKPTDLIKASFQPDYCIPDEHLIEGWIEVDYSNSTHIGLSKGQVVKFSQSQKDLKDELYPKGEVQEDEPKDKSVLKTKANTVHKKVAAKPKTKVLSKK